MELAAVTDVKGVLTFFTSSSQTSSQTGFCECVVIFCLAPSTGSETASATKNPNGKGVSSHSLAGVVTTTSSPFHQTKAMATISHSTTRKPLLP